MVHRQSLHSTTEINAAKILMAAFGPEQLTLNQRVQGSSPCAPTNRINRLGQETCSPTGPQGRFGNILGNILQSSSLTAGEKLAT